MFFSQFYNTVIYDDSISEADPDSSCIAWSKLSQNFPKQKISDVINCRYYGVCPFSL